jgi:hypothetical protein
LALVPHITQPLLQLEYWSTLIILATVLVTVQKDGKYLNAATRQLVGNKVKDFVSQPNVFIGHHLAFFGRIRMEL